MLTKLKDIAVVLATAAFGVFAIWQFDSGTTLDVVLAFVNTLFVMLTLLFGQPALARLLYDKRQRLVSAIDGAQLEKLEDTLKIIVGAAYMVFAILQYAFVIPQETLTNFITALFAVLAAVFGGSAAVRKFKKMVLRTE